jgi:hypothetical protein
VGDLAKLTIWDDPAIRGALSWCLDVAENRRPAQFRIVATERVPAAPVNVMAQFHPDNFCDPASAKYRDKYAEIARRPTPTELDTSWPRARELGLEFETTTFERHIARGRPAMFQN